MDEHNIEDLQNIKWFVNDTRLEFNLANEDRYKNINRGITIDCR